MIDNDAAIITDATNDNPNDGSLDAAVAELLKWEDDAETLSDPEEEDEETDEHEAGEADESDGNETSEDEDEHVDDDGESEAVEDEDERIIKHKVDGKDVEFKVKDAKRLYGREVIISQREIAIAEERKVISNDANLLKIAAMELTKRAEERFKPFKDINWVVDPQKWGPEATANMYELANHAYEDVEFYKNKLGELEKIDAAEKQRLNDAQQQEIRQRKHAMVERLKAERPGVDLNKWHQSLRSEVVSRGIPQAVFDAIDMTEALTLIEDAMLYRRGKTAETRKVTKAPAKVIKTNRSPEAARTATKASQDKNAYKRLQTTGSMDDAMAYLLSRTK